MPRILYPALTEPVLTAAQQPEQVSEDRWHQPFSQPVYRTGLAVAVVVASGIFWAPFTPVAGEVITLDKWNAPLSVPVRDTRGLTTGAQPYLAFVQAAPFAETVSIDRWGQPLDTPRLRYGLSAAQLAASGSIEIKFVPLPPVEWLQPLARPTYLGGLITAEQPYLAFVEAAPFTETVTIDRWQQALSVPVLRTVFPEYPTSFPPPPSPPPPPPPPPPTGPPPMRGFVVNTGKLTEFP